MLALSQLSKLDYSWQAARPVSARCIREESARGALMLRAGSYSRAPPPLPVLILSLLRFAGEGGEGGWADREAPSSAAKDDGAKLAGVKFKLSM